MKNRILVVSLHINGGCFQYGNELFSRLKTLCDIYIPNIVTEQLKISRFKKLLYWKRPTPLRLLSLAWFLVKIVLLGLTGYYKALLLAGFSSWDYYILKAWKLTGRPSIFVVHDGIMHQGEQNSDNQHKLKYLIQKSTILIFLSEFVRDNVCEKLHIHKKSIIVPHGLIDYGALPERRRNSGDLPSLLFLGRVSAYKGVDVLLDAIQAVPDNVYDNLVIAGKWNDEVPSSIPAKTKIIDKWLSTDEIKQFIADSDIMIFPYREATQSGVASLAINYLKPSVVTDAGALPEQFPARGALFAEAGDAESLAKAITALCKDESLRKSQITELSSTRCSLDWDEIAYELDNDLKTLLK